MKKITILLYMTILLVVLVITVLAWTVPIESDAIASDAEIDNKITMWTKGVCNEENYCVDVEITCKGDKVIGIRSISGGVFFSKEWKDPRPEEFRNKWC